MAKRHREAYKQNEDGDFEFLCNPIRPPLVPEGAYVVRFVKAEMTKLYQREKVFLHFSIADGKHLGVILWMACNIAPDGKWRPSHKFWDQWILANGGEPPRPDRMSTLVFKDKIFLAKVTTTTKDGHHVARPHDSFYSKIDRLLKRIE